MVSTLWKSLSSRFGKHLKVQTGSNLIIKGTGLGGIADECEAMQHFGFASSPPEGTILVVIPIGPGSRDQRSVAEHNYNLEITLAPGESINFSSSADGKTLKAYTRYYADGKIKIANEVQPTPASLKTILDNRNSALNTFAQSCASATTVAQIAAAASALVASLGFPSCDLSRILKD